MDREPVELGRLAPDEPLGSMPKRGRVRPRAIAWYGFSAFWGHLRHLVASVIATDNVDSRQWMVPEPPHKLLERAIDRLGGRGASGAPTLCEAMGGELWIDFVSDTGDDVTVSERVAELFSRGYAVRDEKGVRTLLPRGDVLLLGGDLAYPVATVREVTRRLVEPWNRVLSRLPPGPPRVLLAVPGNHDWYDGLDGFARLCQAPCPFEEKLGDEALNPQPSDHPVLAWAEAFARGGQVAKPKAMALSGYEPVQRTSYFRIPLAPGLELFGVDRQLKRVDERQIAFFKVPSDAAARLVVVPDPARAWGEARPHGVATLGSLGLVPGESPTLVLAGDIHHYERSSDGPSLHVVSGGGGAFLHGARTAARASYGIDAEFPGKRASRRMLLALPFHVARGGSGWLVLVLFGLIDAVTLVPAASGQSEETLGASIGTALLLSLGAALLVGWRRHRVHRVVPFAFAFGLALAAIPLEIGQLATGIYASCAHTATRLGVILALCGVATVLSGLLFGALLATLATLGLNHAQPWAALGVAGFKHFIRLRVRACEGRAEVAAWVIGIVDPVRGDPPVLVDSFVWSSARGATRDKDGPDIRPEIECGP